MRLTRGKDPDSVPYWHVSSPSHASIGIIWREGDQWVAHSWYAPQSAPFATRRGAMSWLDERAAVASLSGRA